MLHGDATEPTPPPQSSTAEPATAADGAPEVDAPVVTPLTEPSDGVPDVVETLGKGGHDRGVDLGGAIGGSGRLGRRRLRGRGWLSGVPVQHGPTLRPRTLRASADRPGPRQSVAGPLSARALRGPNGAARAGWRTPPSPPGYPCR